MRVNRKCPNILQTVSPLKEICKKHPIQNLNNTNNNGKMQCHMKKFYGHDLFSKLVCSMRTKVIGKKINLYEQAQIFQYLMPLGDRIYVFWKGFRSWSNWRLLHLVFTSSIHTENGGQTFLGYIFWGTHIVQMITKHFWMDCKQKIKIYNQALFCVISNQSAIMFMNFAPCSLTHTEMHF